PEKQALHYSGKHKTHTDKNVVVVHAKTRRVGYLSQTYAGKTHDKKIADHEALCYPRHVILRTAAFRAMSRPGATPASRKKAAQGALIPEREAAQPGAGAYPGESGACAGGGEALSDCERHTAQHQNRVLGFGNGRRMWFTQSPHPGA